MTNAEIPKDPKNDEIGFLGSSSFVIHVKTLLAAKSQD